MNYSGLLIVGTTWLTMSGAAEADPTDWTPAGPIRMIISQAAGGGADTQARLIAAAMEDRYGWTVLPQQVLGAGGVNAALEVLKEPADGTSIAMIVSQTLGYDALVTDRPELVPGNFTLLATTARFEMGLVAKPNTPFDSWEKLASSGGSVTVGSMSPRTTDVTYLLGKKLGLQLNTVEVQGGGQSMNGVVAGDMDVGWVAGAQNQSVLAGDLVNILSGLPEPLENSPDAPTLRDIGSDFSLDGYFLFVGPADMDEAARKAYVEAFREILGDPESEPSMFIQRAFGGAAVLTGDELDSYIAADRAEAEQLLQAVSN